MHHASSPAALPAQPRARKPRTLGLWAVAAVGLFVAIGPAACGTSNGDGTPNGSLVNCTPNANVFCLCEDGANGTKRCASSGHAFGPCTTGANGVCKKEIPSEDTGKPVDDAGKVVDEGDASPPPDKPPADPIEACPGLITAVPAGTELTLTGDTTGATDDAKGQGVCSVGEQGHDHVYRLKPTAKGSLNIKVAGKGAMNPTVYLRSVCEDESAQVKCAETTGAGATETLTANVKAGLDYYLFVDSSAGTAGPYTATLKLTAGYFCGDGDVDANEACDDGNKVEGDGCSNGCTHASGDPPSGGGCPGQPVHVWPGKLVTASGSTTPYTNTWQNTGTSCLVSATALNKWPEHVYQVTAHAAGKLLVDLTPDPKVNLMLIARSTCDDPQSQTGAMCANAGSAGASETMTFSVKNGETVFVAVDGAGADAAQGTYDITFKIIQ